MYCQFWKLLNCTKIIKKSFWDLINLTKRSIISMQFSITHFFLWCINLTSFDFLKLINISDIVIRINEINEESVKWCRSDKFLGKWICSAYFSWLCAFLFQLNPLIGPQLDSSLIAFIQAEWENTPVKPVSIPQSPQHS